MPNPSQSPEAEISKVNDAAVPQANLQVNWTQAMNDTVTAKAPSTADSVLPNVTLVNSDQQATAIPPAGSDAGNQTVEPISNNSVGDSNATANPLPPATFLDSSNAGNSIDTTTNSTPNGDGGYESIGPNGVTTTMPTAGGGYESVGPDGVTTTMPTAGGGYISYGADGGTTTTMPTAGGGYVSYGADGGTTTTMPTAGGGYISYGPDGSTTFTAPPFGGG